jgi:UDPglucose--hexose-1-phosphate uridylyltransferase
MWWSPRGGSSARSGPVGGARSARAGLEAPEPYDVRHFPNRWPALPHGCHDVILHSPDHQASFPVLGEEQAARVVDLWSARTAAFGARDDVAYVFVFENRGRQIGATIDHPHSQIMAFTMVPPVVAAELAAGKCELCQGTDEELVVIRRSGWQVAVPWAPSWPYEMLLSPAGHVPDLPAAGPELRAGLGAVLVEALRRMERRLGRCRSHSGPGFTRRLRAAPTGCSR